MPRASKPADGAAKPPPDEATLREAALRHLARYATTKAGLLRVLHRRIDRWAREATSSHRNEASGPEGRPDKATGGPGREARDGATRGRGAVQGDPGAGEAGEGALGGEDIAGLVSHARQIAAAVVAALAQVGVVSDQDFAAARAHNLIRAGRSRRAVAAHLVARGVDNALAQQAMPDNPDAELAAALIMARRRRVGPFRAEPLADDAARHKELAILARGGFSHAVASRALEMSTNEAEERILALRR